MSEPTRPDDRDVVVDYLELENERSHETDKERYDWEGKTEGGTARDDWESGERRTVLAADE